MSLSIIIPCRNEPDIIEMMEETEKLFPNAQIIVSSDRYSNGKGWAIRQGLKEATGEYVCFIDGDMDIHPFMICRLIPFMADNDIAVGVKPISGLWSRRILTYLSRIYLAIFFGLKVDSQTGIKLFKREAIDEFYSNGFLFDLEILSLAKQKGFKMIEVPIDANVRRKMKLKSIWNTLKESVTLWLELR